MAFARGDMAAVEEAAHSLKGALRSLSAVALSLTAQRLELLAHDGDMAKTAEVFAELKEQITHLSISLETTSVS